MNAFKQQIEQGNAEIRVELKGGFIRVYHAEDGVLLHKRIAYQGDWAELWNELSRPDRGNSSVLSRRELSKKLSLEICTYIFYALGLFLGFKFIMFLIYVFA